MIPFGIPFVSSCATITVIHRIEFRSVIHRFWLGQSICVCDKCWLEFCMPWQLTLKWNHRPAFVLARAAVVLCVCVSCLYLFIFVPCGHIHFQRHCAAGPIKWIHSIKPEWPGCLWLWRAKQPALNSPSPVEFVAGDVRSKIVNYRRYFIRKPVTRFALALHLKMRMRRWPECVMSMRFSVISVNFMFAQD